MANKGLHDARKVKKDEFYTQLTDIEKELKNYKQHFKGKTILCNCDDPRVSKFFYFFYSKFYTLGLKRLIATCYKNLNPDLFSRNLDEQAVYCIYDGKDRANDVITDYDTFIRRNEWGVLKGDGDFRSSECIELLKQTDIVCTNPPFSLFREYVSQLIEYEKKFIIIGSVNAVTYKEIFTLFKENKIWLGQSIHSGDREFGVPDSYPLDAAGFRVGEDGKKYIRVKGVRWFTNLDYKELHEKLTLYKRYNEKEFPKYDNYDAIEVSETKDIPQDYDGVMGVPITFLDKYNPDQFEILGMSASAGYNADIVGLPKLKAIKDARPLIDGKNTYARVFIKRRGNK
ncbi:MAG: adenine-specific methyltransferase EcoRI family protein [Spirochaetaceae bacterium]|jgi:hypothetical protein|nr:adenine-specific methyltransferase EcoRI family protein [Spirochaetaceae bacterium]